MAEGIPVFIPPGALDIMSGGEVPELGVMSGNPGPCSMPELEGGVTDVGGVFMLGPDCEPGACQIKDQRYRK